MTRKTRRNKRRKYKKTGMKKRRAFDFHLLVVTLLLSFFGLLIVYDASVIEAFRKFGDKYHFVRQQAIWVSIGIVFLGILSFIPLQIFKRIGIWIYALSIVLLILVLIPAFGKQTLGARRWLTIGGISVQPAELTKLTLVIYLASYLQNKRKLLQFVLVTITTGLLIILEPDLGTTVVIMGVATSMYFLSGAPIRHFIFILISGLLAGSLFIVSSEYRRARVQTFINPTQDPLGASYHIRQVLIAVGSGGLFGLGIGKSRQKFEYIPAATTDSIFAILAEEIGFVGSFVVLFLFAYLIYRAYLITKQAPNNFSKLLAAGIVVWLGLQTTLNLATMVALVPLTGVPLPFISYGGSSTLANLSAVGILLNISRHAKRK